VASIPMDTGLRRHDDIGKHVFLAYTQFPHLLIAGNTQAIDYRIKEKQA